MKNKYMKTTVGQNAQVFVAKATAYTDDATYDLFVANAVEGEMGVFLVYDASGPTTYKESVAATNASDAALQAGDRFFIAQKRDSLIHRTPVYTYNEFKARQEAYVAPVKQVTNVGYDGSSGSLNSGTLTTGQIFPIKLIETTPANMPFPTWAFEEVCLSASDTLVAIGARLLKQINNTLSAQNQYNGRLVDAELLTNGTFVASSGGSATVTNGSTTVTIVESAGAAADGGKYNADASSMVVGQYLRIGGTAATSPVYKIAAISGAGSATCTITLDSPYTGSTGTVTAANVLVNTVAPTEIGFKFTAIDYGAHFRVAVAEDIATATVTYTTPFKLGVGTYEQVLQIEQEGQVFSGYTTLNEAFTADYGQPTTFADSTKTYQFIYLDYYRSKSSAAAPKVADNHYGNIVIVCPVGVAPTTNLDGIFVTL